MTDVRLFCHGPMIALPISAASARYAHGDVMVLPQPYLSRQTIQGGFSEPAPAGTGVLCVEVEPGKTIAYEIMPEGQTRTADKDSPRLAGSARFNYGKGWRVHVLDVTADATPA